MGDPLAMGFPQIPNGCTSLSTVTLHPAGHAETRGGTPAKTALAPGPAGYPSPVCSSIEDALDRVAAAIDQLATDAQGKPGDPELAMRVAGLWQMMSALDPELARRAQRYTTPLGGAPQAN